MENHKGVKPMTRFPKFDFNKFETQVLHKPKILGALDGLGGNVVDFTKYYHTLNEDEHMEFEERAAIMEYDAGLTREEAEAQALHNVVYMRDYQHDRK